MALDVPYDEPANGGVVTRELPNADVVARVFAVGKGCEIAVGVDVATPTFPPTGAKVILPEWPEEESPLPPEPGCNAKRKLLSPSIARISAPFRDSADFPADTQSDAGEAPRFTEAVPAEQ